MVLGKVRCECETRDQVQEQLLTSNLQALHYHVAHPFHSYDYELPLPLNTNMKSWGSGNITDLRIALALNFVVVVQSKGPHIITTTKLLTTQIDIIHII